MPLLAACGDKNTYVLVHGAFQGAWAWDKVKVELEKEGHEVVTVDLPGHGADTTAFSQVSLQSYTGKVLQAIDAQEGPVILVGHSMGGTVISNVIEARADKVEHTVYVAAYLLKDGASGTRSARRHGARARARPDTWWSPRPRAVGGAARAGTRGQQVRHALGRHEEQVRLAPPRTERGRSACSPGISSGPRVKSGRRARRGSHLEGSR